MPKYPQRPNLKIGDRDKDYPAFLTINDRYEELVSKTTVSDRQSLLSIENLIHNSRLQFF